MMAYPFAFSPIRAAALALLCAGLSACTTVLLPPNVVPVAPLSHSVEQADRKLEEAAQERAAIEARYAASEQVCYTKFFVNNCLDAAKEKRRSGLAAVRAVEVEAEYFKRKAAADERDRALAEALKEEEARAAQRAAEPPKPARDEAPPAPPKPISAKVNREAAHAAKLRRIAEQEQAGAGKRAANVERFERKKRESEERQRAVAEKKAAKAEQAAKDAQAGQGQ